MPKSHNKSSRFRCIFSKVKKYNLRSSDRLVIQNNARYCFYVVGKLTWAHINIEQHFLTACVHEYLLNVVCAGDQKVK